MANIIDLERALSIPVARIRMKKVKREMTSGEWNLSKKLFDLYRHGYDLYMGNVPTDWTLTCMGRDLMNKVVEYANEHEYMFLLKPWTFAIFYAKPDDIIAIIPKKYENLINHKKEDS